MWTCVKCRNREDPTEIWTTTLLLLLRVHYSGLYLALTALGLTAGSVLLWIPERISQHKTIAFLPNKQTLLNALICIWQLPRTRYAVLMFSVSDGFLYNLMLNCSNAKLKVSSLGILILLFWSHGPIINDNMTFDQCLFSHKTFFSKNKSIKQKLYWMCM